MLVRTVRCPWPSAPCWRQWQNYNGYHLDEPIDQIANLINELKTNPDSRRLMVSAWNVGELDQMTLPPCHHSFQMYTRELSRAERVENYNSQIQADVMFNWRSFNHFLSLRNKPDAQKEIREIAAEMLRLVKNIEGNPFEHTIAAFEL